MNRVEVRYICFGCATKLVLVEWSGGRFGAEIVYGDLCPMCGYKLDQGQIDDLINRAQVIAQAGSVPVDNPPTTSG